MSTRTDKPMDSASAEEAAEWVAAAERLRARVSPAHASALDYTWRSLYEVDQVVDELRRTTAIDVRTTMGLAAYLGEVLVRQYAGAWATGERYGEVLAPPAAGGSPGTSFEPARPVEMIERRLGKGDSLQHQVFELLRGWGVDPDGHPTRAAVNGPAASMRLAAEAFVRSAVSSGVTWLDYSTGSVLRLDSLIDRWWPSGPPLDEAGTVAPAMGAYLGEVLAMETGAGWVRDEARGYGLEYRGQVVFPATEVTRRLQLGPARAIAQFFEEVSTRWRLENETKTTSRDRAGREKRARSSR
jgi:hypothetical protein